MYTPIIDFCNLSIVVFAYDNNWSIISEFFKQNETIFKQNGCEIIIAVKDELNEQNFLNYFESKPFLNWKLVKVGHRPAKEVLLRILKYCDFGWLLLLDINTVFYKKTLSEFIVLSTFYQCTLIRCFHKTYLNHLNPSEDNETMIFLNQEKLFDLLKGQDFSSISDLIRIAEYNGHECLNIENGFTYFNEISEKYNIWRTYDQYFESNDSEVEISFNYNNKAQLSSSGLSYFKNFLQYSLVNEKVFCKQFNLIVLVSVYNESKHIESFLNNISNRCDAIICLDDDSTDGSYELINHSKLILKVKKERQKFDDLSNRNTLLKLAHFFHAKWLLFLDADERIDDRFEKIENLLSKDNMVYSFNFVNVWDENNSYRQDILQESINNKEGIFKRYRLFRNMGHLQIRPQNERRLHFPTVPYQYKSEHAKVLIHHLGTLTKKERRDKYNFYLNEDQNEVYSSTRYKYLVENNPKLRSIDSLKEEDLE